MKKQDNPIRIAQIVGKWLGGGVEAVIMNYYRNIDHSKVQFDFICDNDSINIPYEEIEKLGGKVILIPPYQSVFKYQKELKRVLKEGNYKIVHSHINTLSVFSLFAAWRAKIPVRIAHSHSTIINDKREFKRNILKNILKNFSKLFATDYFACSDTAAISQFGKKTFDNGEVVIINNAIDLNRFKYDEDLRKQKRLDLNISDDQVVIGHLGRFVETKNHSFIIDLFNEYHKRNPKSVLVFAGQGPLEKVMKEKVKSLGIEDSVKFLGHKKHAYKVYQAMDLFILPSLYEGLGMVLIEAQASGLPCIASTGVPPIAKITDNFEFIDLKDEPEKWLNSIEKLITCKREDKSKDVIKNGYDIRTEATKLENIYINKGEI